MFQKQQSGKRLYALTTGLVLCGALIGVLYYPRITHVEEDTPAIELVDLHQSLEIASDEANLQLIQMNDVKQFAHGIREKIGSFYSLGITELSKCQDEACKFKNSYNNMQEIMTMLKNVNFFAGNATEGMINHKNLNEAFSFVRDHQAALTKGDIDVTLNNDIAVLQSSSNILRDTINDMSAISIRIAYDTVDFVKYLKVASKYVGHFQKGGQLSLHDLMDLDEPLPNPKPVPQIDDADDITDDKFYVPDLDDIDFSDIDFGPGNLLELTAIKGYDFDYDVTKARSVNKIAKVREQYEHTTFKAFDRGFLLLQKSMKVADEKMGEIINRITKVQVEMKEAVYNMQNIKDDIKSAITKENKKIEKDRKKLVKKIALAIKGSGLAEKSKKKIDFIMKPVETAKIFKCPEQDALRLQENCHSKKFKASKGWWELMNGPDKNRAKGILEGIYGNINGKNHWDEYVKEDSGFRVCEKKASEIRGVCRGKEQEWRNAQAIEGQNALIEYRKNLIKAQKSMQQQHWKKDAEIYKMMEYKVKQDVAVQVNQQGLEERKTLWQQWQSKFEIIQQSADSIQATADGQKQSAEKHKLSLETNIESFASFRSDNTPANIDWDIVNMKEIIGQAAELFKISKVAYKQCSNEIENYKKMIDKNMEILIKNNGNK